MAGLGICVLCLADTCTSEVHPVFNLSLHLMDICFLTCICLWQISQIQTFLFKVVGPGLVSTSPAFVSSSASHPAGPHWPACPKTVNRAPIAGGGGGSTQFAQQLESRCDSSTACRLCRLERNESVHQQLDWQTYEWE